jgi:excisionase family DNA binding protein
MSLIAIPLPDGRWLALEPAELQLALIRGAEMGLSPAKTVPPPVPAATEEKLVNSRELAAIVGVGDTTLEAKAARGEIPSYRIGKALRFNVADVKAALKAAKTLQK